MNEIELNITIGQAQNLSWQTLERQYKNTNKIPIIDEFKQISAKMFEMLIECKQWMKQQYNLELNKQSESYEEEIRTEDVGVEEDEIFG